MISRVCGECAAPLLRGGASIVNVADRPGAQIRLGMPCERHPGSIDVQATMVVEADAFPAIERASDPSDDVPSTIGPLTELAARLLVARVMLPDEDGVRRSVELARALLSETKGR